MVLFQGPGFVFTVIAEKAVIEMDLNQQFRTISMDLNVEA